ncbi:MAG: glycosyltransferase family 2 protein [Phocaeicola sp.]|nr:glycosyltransferase family 2 protein [Phocaeicola sp.]
MKISIITTCYNSEKTISDTIDSILNQNYINYEYIIIDGSSKDNTISIIKKYKNLFGNKLLWISENDNGIYDAMNKGIQMATGDVIGILNSDDFYTNNNILSRIADEFEKNTELDAIYGDIHFVDSNNLNKCVRYYSSKIFKRQLMRLGFMPAHPSFYIKKDKLLEIGLYKTNYKIAADFEFLLRAIYVNKIKTKYIPLDIVTMRTGGASTSGISSHKTIMKEHLRAFRENNVYTNIILLSLRYFYKIYEVWIKRQ